MRIADINIALIDILPGRRVVDKNWIEALAADMEIHGQMQPIEVVQTDDRFRLISGAHRIGASKLRGLTTVTAIVKEAASFASEADMKLREIAENFMRRGLSVLDRAQDVSEWRKIYEDVQGAVKSGPKRIRGKSAPNSEEQIDADISAFAATFTFAAQTALNLNKDAIKRALRIASIDAAVRARIATYPIADNQSELLALAAESPERQSAISGMLLALPPLAHTVAGAIAILDRVPVAAKAEPWARLSDKFSKLPDLAQRRFFREHWDLIEVMIAEGAAR